MNMVLITDALNILTPFSHQREEKSTKTTALHRHTEFIIYSNYQLAVCLSGIIAFQITKASLLIHFSLFAKRKEKKKELSSTMDCIDSNLACSQDLTSCASS